MDLKTKISILITKKPHQILHEFGFFSIILSVVYFNLWLYFYIINKPLLTLEWLHSEMLHIATGIMITSLLLLASYKNKTPLFIGIFVFNLYLICNTIYFRTFNSIMPISSFVMFENLNGLRESILSSFEPIDILFILPSIILATLYRLHFKKVSFSSSLKARAIILILLILISTTITCVNLYSSKNSRVNLLTNQNLFRVDLTAGVRNYGFINYWIWEIRHYSRSNKTLTTTDRNCIEGWIRHHKKLENTDLNFRPTHKNIIIVIIESLENFPIGLKIGNIEITPTLNQIISENKHRIYIPHIIPQVNGGRSSDAQLIINTGLLPINSGATSFECPKNNYYSLAKALKKTGYYSITLLGQDASYWNQSVLSRDLGYTNLTSIKDFNQDEIYNLGLTDSSFFSQTINKLASLPQPFFAQLITLSSHKPFTLPQNRRYFTANTKLPTDISNYLNSIKYVDKCLGNFVQGLKKKNLLNNTTIIFTGDHEAFRNRVSLQNKLFRKINTTEPFIPFIAINTDINKDYTQTIGQIDIYPTLVELFGITYYQWHGLGQSIFNKHRIKFAVDAKHKLWGDSSNITSKEIIHTKTAWDISNLMINKYYFGKTH